MQTLIMYRGDLYIECDLRVRIGEGAGGGHLYAVKTVALRFSVYASMHLNY